MYIGLMLNSILFYDAKIILLMQFTFHFTINISRILDMQNIFFTFLFIFFIIFFFIFGMDFFFLSLPNVISLLVIRNAWETEKEGERLT